MNRLVAILVFIFSASQLLGGTLYIDSADYGGLLEIGTANDLFQARSNSDKYYSASFRASYLHPVFDSKFARKFLVGDDKGNNFFGLVLRQNGFTPDDLSDPNVIVDDRPYAGLLTLQYWRVSKKDLDWEYSNAFKFGVLGPASMVEQVQTWLHEATGSTPPMGWHNQIANALVVDYYARAEKRFLKDCSWVLLGAGASGELGSLLNAFGVHSRLRVGKYYEDPKTMFGLNYRKIVASSKWQVYADFIVAARYVLYDGTLQGGLLAFNDSPHVYSSGDYKHVTGNLTYRLSLSYQNLMLMYTSTAEIDRFFVDEFFNFGSINFIIPIGRR